MSCKLLYPCPLCRDFQATEFSLLLPHIRLVHSTRPGFVIPCPMDNCTRLFTKMKTYTNHIYGDHLSLPRATSSSIDVQLALPSHNESADEEQESEMDVSSQDAGANEPQPDDTQCEFNSIIAMWILKIKEMCKLPQSTIEKIIEGVTDLCQYLLTQIYEDVKLVLSDAHICTDNMPNFKEIFDPNGKYGMPFKNMKSSHQLLEHCKRHFHIVVIFLTKNLL